VDSYGVSLIEPDSFGIAGIYNALASNISMAEKIIICSGSGQRNDPHKQEQKEKI
jgi:hypothetical protein